MGHLKDLTDAKCVHITVKLPCILAIVKGGIVFVLANRVPASIIPDYTRGEKRGWNRKRDLPIFEKMLPQKRRW